MKRSIPLLALASLITLTASKLAAAQLADYVPTGAPLIGHYRFLPRFSTLNESGGFGGRNTDFRVFGEFDLWNAERNPHTDGAGVTFQNVKAWASHPILAYVLNLDNTLALSELWGEQLPVLGPFDAYRFTGKTDDGSSVDLFAVALGPWLRVRGGTTPPPGSADYFTYRLDALARQTPFADFDDDGAVDGKDLARIMSRLGESAVGNVSFGAGDANRDGAVDGSDFLTWQRQVGQVAPPLAPLDGALEQAVAVASAASIQAVPEPASAIMLAVGALLLSRTVVRRR